MGLLNRTTKRKTMPVPPLELRKIIGSVDESMYDNPDGNLIWGPLAFGPLLPGEAYSSVFDFGCGCGREARQLMLQKQVPSKYLGIDVSEVLINWCKKNLAPYNREFQFLHHDARHPTYAPNNSENRVLPFPSEDSQFSLVNANSVFTHLYYDQAEYYLKEAKRVLVDKGLIRSTWFFFNKKIFPILAENQYCIYVNELDPSQAVYYDYEQFLILIHSLGLAIVSIIWTKVVGFQTQVFLGKTPFFRDISNELIPPKTIIGY